MAVTIDTKTLHVTSLEEHFSLAKVETDDWAAVDGYKRKLLPFGAVNAWTLTCFEDKVQWTDSVARYLEAKMISGTTVTLIIDVQGSFSGAEKLHMVTSTTVAVLEVIVSYPKGFTDYREFTLVLQDSP